MCLAFPCVLRLAIGDFSFAVSMHVDVPVFTQLISFCLSSADWTTTNRNTYVPHQIKALSKPPIQVFPLGRSSEPDKGLKSVQTLFRCMYTHVCAAPEVDIDWYIYCISVTRTHTPSRTHLVCICALSLRLNFNAQRTEEPETRDFLTTFHATYKAQPQVSARRVVCSE